VTLLEEPASFDLRFISTTIAIIGNVIGRNAIMASVGLWLPLPNRIAAMVIGENSNMPAKHITTDAIENGRSPFSAATVQQIIAAQIVKKLNP
jgi:hypothetical protein